MAKLLRKLLGSWIAFGRVLGVINLTVLLGVVYLLLVPFYALVYRLRDPMALRAARRKPASHWRPAVPPRADADGLWRPY